DAADPYPRPALASRPLARRRQLGAARPEGADGHVRELAEILQVPIERMASDEEADGIALVAQLLLRSPGLARRQRGWLRVDLSTPCREESELRARLLLGAE